MKSQYAVFIGKIALQTSGVFTAHGTKLADKSNLIFANKVSEYLAQINDASNK
jgi:hypothetical protein